MNRYTFETDPKTLVSVRCLEDKRWQVSWKDESGKEMHLGRSEQSEFGFERLQRAWGAGGS